MSTRLLTAITAILISLSANAETITISGKISGENISEAKIYFFNADQESNKFTYDKNNKTYSISVYIEQPAFAHIAAVAKGATDSKATQLYAPVYLNPDKSAMIINIQNNGSETQFEPQDENNKILVSYYQDFLIPHLQTIPPANDSLITTYLTRITQYADSLADNSSTIDIKNYIRLRGHIDRIHVTRQIQDYYSRLLKTLPEEATDGIKSVAQLQQMPGAGHLAKEIAMLINYNEIGAPAPDVELCDTSGNIHSLSEFKGKYIYVDLWASWCGPCNMEIPHLKELERTIDNDAIVFIGISVDEDVNDWKAALDRHQLRGNQFIATRELSQMLNIQSIPRYVIFDKDGKMLNPNAPRPSSGNAIRDLLRQLK